MDFFWRGCWKVVEKWKSCWKVEGVFNILNFTPSIVKLLVFLCSSIRRALEASRWVFPFGWLRSYIFCSKYSIALSMQQSPEFICICGFKHFFQFNIIVFKIKIKIFENKYNLATRYELLIAITLKWNNVFHIRLYMWFVQQKFGNIFTVSNIYSFYKSIFF